jgi:hypothetical protein
MAANTVSVVNGVGARKSIRTPREFSSPVGLGPRTTTRACDSRSSNCAVVPNASVA